MSPAAVRCNGFRAVSFDRVDAFDDALRVVASLNKAGVDYIVVGGMALNLRAFLLCPPVRQRGVTRFRSIEEANEARLRTTLQRMRRTAGTAG